MKLVVELSAEDRARLEAVARARGVAVAELVRGWIAASFDGAAAEHLAAATASLQATIEANASAWRRRRELRALERKFAMETSAALHEARMAALRGTETERRVAEAARDRERAAAERIAVLWGLGLPPTATAEDVRRAVRECVDAEDLYPEKYSGRRRKPIERRLRELLNLQARALNVLARER